MSHDFRAPRVFTDRELAEALRKAGLHARALAAWTRTDRISALPSLLPGLLASEPTPAAATLAMFVGGARVRTTTLALLGDSLALLARRGLVEIEGDHARAMVAIMPVGSSLFVCDRLDVPASEDLVCWPDDSSLHLAACLPPGRRETWLDLGCGSGFAPLARPELASRIVGTDLNARALQHAALGASLSGVPLIVFGGDVGANVPASWRGACELVSCNAPMPAIASTALVPPDGPVSRATATPASSTARSIDEPMPVWRHAPADIVERMVDAAASFAARDAMIVIHAVADELTASLAKRRGDKVIVRYTPDEVRGFAVAWWAPDGTDRLVERQRLLTPEAPHLTHADGHADGGQT